MPKIAFLTSTLSYGGATKIMIEVANSLTDDYAVSFITYNMNCPFYNIASNVSIENVKIACDIPKLRFVAQVFRVRQVLKKNKPDMLIAFGNTEKIIAIIASIGLKCKVIISERQDPYSYKPNRKHYMWGWYLLADGCVFQTKGAMEYFPNSVKRKSTVIPNFISCKKSKFIPFKNKEKIISFNARFELRQKRQDIMVEAFADFHKEYPEWVLEFVGDGIDQPLVEELVKDKGLSDCVIFRGKVQNPLVYMSRASIFCLTSDFEGIPNVLLEAMALGLPVISTDCSPGGARELIHNQRNGVLCDIGDSNAICNALKNYVDNPDFADECGKNAMNVIETFAPPHILPKWKEYFDSFLC